MSERLSPKLLARLSERVAAQMGLHFPPARWSDLEWGLRSAAPDLGFEDAEECARWLLSQPHLSKRQVEALADHLTIGETYFWREKNTFAALEERILPALIRARRGGERHLRLWSAGCCTGEEPYSLAILVHRLLPDPRGWSVTIRGTDIVPRFLHKASAGVYGEWSFRDAPPWLRERYFRKMPEDRWAVVPEIKTMVTFSPLNLAEDVYPSLAGDTNAMDVILCRNVLMYLTPERSEKAVGGFHRALVEGGWLIVSPSESLHLLSSAFVPTAFPGATFYRKEGRPASNPVSPPPPRPAEAPEPSAPPAAPAEAYEAARTLYEQGRYAEAVETLGAEPGEPRAMALRARAYANLGELEEARRWCERALAGEKLNPGDHYLHATILQEQGALDEAVRSLKRALFLDSDFALAHFALGNLTERQGKVGESERHFANALLLLGRYPPEAALPESEGITAGRLAGIIASRTSVSAAPDTDAEDEADA